MPPPESRVAAVRVQRIESVGLSTDDMAFVDAGPRLGSVGVDRIVAFGRAPIPTASPGSRCRGHVALVSGGRGDLIAAGSARWCAASPSAHFHELAQGGPRVAGDADDAFPASVIDFLGAAMPAAVSGAPAPSTTLEESHA